jgi:hypothetical protein
MNLCQNCESVGVEIQFVTDRWFFDLVLVQKIILNFTKSIDALNFSKADKHRLCLKDTAHFLRDNDKN